MYISQNLTGYIIRVFPAKTADHVVHMINASGSRTVFFSTSTRKSKSRKGYSIDLLNRVSIKLNKGKAELPYLNEINLFDSPRSRLTSLHGLTSIQLLCELVDLYCLEEQDQPELFITLDQAIRALNNEDNVIIFAALMIKLISISGELPELNLDIETGTTINNEADRSLSMNGVGYQLVDAGHDYISDRIYKVQRFSINASFNDICNIRMQQQELLKLLQISFSWIETSIQRELKTKKLFMDSL